MSLPGPVETTLSTESRLPYEKENRIRPIVKILDATVELVDEAHPFGAVLGGVLHIQGPLANSSLLPGLAYREDRKGLTAYMTHKGKVAGSYRFDTAMYSSRLKCKKPFHLLPVMSGMSYISGWIKKSVSGMILQEADCGNNTFRRIGAFAVDPPRGRDKSGDEYTDGIRMLQEACHS